MLKLSLNKLIKRFESHHQEHVFEYYDTLDVDGQNQLRAQAEMINLPEFDQWVRRLVVEPSSDNFNLASIKAPPYIEFLADREANFLWQDALKVGEEAIKKGLVAVVTVAGGQGTRLGFKGPKGGLQITPVRHKYLFQIFAEKILAAQHRYSAYIPWYIMTSSNNHEETLNFLERHRFFGLEKVELMTQDVFPCVDKRGKILMESPSSIAMSPSGHGGVFKALKKNGVFEKNEGKNIQLVSYHQVDNPLARVIDPYFIGFHILKHSEMSSKIVVKEATDEKVGVFCEVDGRLSVVEYSDLPEKLASEREQSGRLKFYAGNIALHLIDRTFIEKINAESDLLPLHRAYKKIKTMSSDDMEDVPNGYKFELFVFDALPFAKNALLFEVARKDEFSPIKNAVGDSSPQTCQKDMIELHARWLELVGVQAPRNKLNQVTINLEISPLFAEDAISFKKKWESLVKKPVITDSFYLE